MSAALLELLERRRLVLVSGVGGSGRTTAAALLGILAARRGRRVLLLGADPMRRLGDRLGLSTDCGDAPTPVPLPTPGELHVWSPRAADFIDRTLERLSADPERLARLSQTPLLRVLREVVFDVQEFMFFEALERGLRSHELLLVDLPPGRAATRLFDAPARLGRFRRALARFAHLGQGSFWTLPLRTALSAIVGGDLSAQALELLALAPEALSGWERQAQAGVSVLTSGASYALVLAPPRPEGLRGFEGLEDSARLLNELRRNLPAGLCGEGGELPPLPRVGHGREGLVAAAAALGDEKRAARVV